MKLFALLAVIAVAAAEIRYRHICEHEDANFNLESIDALEIKAREFLDPRTDKCITEEQSLTDLFFSNDACVALFDAGYCYGNVVYARYEGENADSLEWAEVSEGIEDVRYMGKLACRKVEECFAPMKEAFLACWNNDNGEFEQQIWDNGALLYSVASAYADALQESNDKDMVSVLMEMARSEFDSFEAIKTAIQENSDAIQEGWDSAVETASEFCDAECVDASADYATVTLDATAGEGACHTVGEFCGECQEATSEYFESNPPPCCLTTVIDAALDRYYELNPKVKKFVKKMRKKVNKEGKAKMDRIESGITCAIQAYDTTYTDTEKCPEILTE